MTQATEIPIEDLPHWMRQARRGRDWGILLAILLGILAAWPFIIRPGLARTNASENFVYLTADYADAMREGRLYPRWSPNAINGYGAPIPHYFPPGAPYTAALIKVLFTNDDVRAVRVTFILGFIMAAAATYAFVRQRVSAVAGLIATTLFIYGPVFGNTTPYVRGELAEFLSLALVPLLLWMTERLMSGSHLSDYLITAAVTAALLLTHPFTALVGIGVSTAMIWSSRLHPRRAALTSLGAGAGLAVFYWMPALLEHQYVTWIASSAPVSQLSLSALLSPLQPIDLNELIPQPQFTLGAPLMLLTTAAVVSRIVVRQWQVQLLFLSTGLGVIALGVLVLPQETWLLGPASLCLAVSSSTLLNWRQHLPFQWRRIYPAALMTLALILSLPVLLVPEWPPVFGGVEPVDQIVYEQRGAGIAVLPPRYPLPLAMPQIPSTNRLLLSGYETGNINKIVPLQAANRTQISLIAHETHRERFQVQSNESTLVSLLTAYFPGWQASASGRALHVYPNEQTGLITFEIPPMSGELVVALGPTPVRQTAWWLSLVVFLVMLLLWRRIRRPTEPSMDVDLLGVGETRLLSLIVTALAIIIIIIATPSSPITLYGRPGHGLDETTMLRARTNAGLEMLAYRLETREFRPGSTLRLSLYWQALRTLPANYQVRLSLTQPNETERPAFSEQRSPGHYPTTRWRTYRYINDNYNVPLPETLPLGEYQLVIEIFDCNPGCTDTNRLTFFNIAGTNIGQSLTLPNTIRVLR